MECAQIQCIPTPIMFLARRAAASILDALTLDATDITLDQTNITLDQTRRAPGTNALTDEAGNVLTDENGNPLTY